MMADRRSELKLAYKNRPLRIGVYQLKNEKNGKILVGSSLNLDKAFNRFIFGLNYGDDIHLNKDLRKDWQEYGQENFSFEVLDQLKPSEDPLYNYKEDLATLEELWLEKLQPYDEKGYNQRKK
jgi:group I intron endonuclease